MEKKTITLNLTEREMRALEDLCAKKDLTKTGLLKQALRMYQLLDSRIERGERIFFESDKQEKMEMIFV